MRDKFTLKLWEIEVFGQKLDLSSRANQALSLAFERIFMISYVLRQNPITTRVLETALFRLVRKLDPSLVMSLDVRFSVFSIINSILDHVYLTMFNMVVSLKQIKRLLEGILRRKEILPAQNIKVIWDAVNYSEFSLNKETRTFTWVLDEQSITKDKVLFLLWQNPSIALKTEIQNLSLNAFTMEQLYGKIPVSLLIKSFWKVLLGVISRIFLAFFSMFHSLKLKFILEIMRYEPIFSHLKPSVYVECNSQIGHEGAQIEFIASKKIHTILYCYSANSYSWTSKKEGGCQFRNVIYADIMAEQMVTWHKNFSDFIMEHVQPRCQSTVLAPLMAGDESVMFEPVSQVRRGFGLLEEKKYRYVSVFDVAAISKDMDIPDLYPVHYTEAYVRSFLNDIMRLVSDFDDLFFIYKPKRDLKCSLVDYSQNFIDKLEALTQSGRGMVIKENINPWLPIQVADICIGLPFTSPVVAAVHHGKHGLFHDPAGVTNWHRYQEITEFISTDYETLRENVRRCLSAKENPPLSHWQNFIGYKQGINATAEFRNILQKTINREIN